MLTLMRYIAGVGVFFVSSRRRHTRCALVTGVQTCALPISLRHPSAIRALWRHLPVVECARSGRRAGAHPRPDRRDARWRALCQHGDGAGEGIGQLQCRSEEHTSELQSLMRISYAVFCLKKKKKKNINNNHKHNSDRQTMT